jgi:drug/metabolite transporter (DMT)-like permease
VRRYSVDLGLLFVALVWGVSPTLFKFALAQLQPLAFVFARFALLSAVSVAVLAWRGWHGGRAWRIARGDVVALIVSGLCGYGVYQLFYMVGLSHTTVFSSAMLVATVPLWSVILVASVRTERVHPLQWVGIGVSLLGTLWFLQAARSARPELAPGHVLGAGDQVLGDLLSLGAAVLFAIYGVVNRRLARAYSPPELMCYTLLVGTVALAPFGLPAVLRQNWASLSWTTWLILPYSVIFPIYLTYSIWNWAIGLRGVGYVTVYSYLVPVLGGLVAFVVLGEALSLGQYVGGAIILGGMLVARRGIAIVARRGTAAGRRARAVDTSRVGVPPADAPPQPLASAHDSASG